MEEVFYGLDTDKADLFEECIQDPLTDVSSTLWPLLGDLTGQTSSLTEAPSGFNGANGSLQESDAGSARACELRKPLATSAAASSEGSQADASDRTSTPPYGRKRGSEDFSGPAYKVRVKQGSQAREQVNSILQACQALQARNRMLEHTAATACALSSELCCTESLQAQAHESLLKSMMGPYAAALSWPDLTTPPILGVLTLEIFISGILPNYLEHMRKLLESGGWDASSAAGQQLISLVHQRRLAEERIGLCTKWADMLMSWNQQEAATLTKPPSTTFHISLLAGLRLSQAQVQELVAARRRLLAALLSVQERREAAILAMGLALLQQPTQGHVQAASIPLAEIQQTLEEERLAVATFLHTCILQVLTPAQEAYLDCQCHPWCPDLWAMAGLLAEHQPGEPSRAAEAALLPACKLGQPEAAGSSEKERAKGVSLQMGAFGLLRAPLLGRGAGLSLKRLLTMQPLSAAAGSQKQPSHDRPLTVLRNTKLLEAFAGRTSPLPSRSSVGAPATHRGATASYRGDPCKALEQQCLQRLAPPSRPYPSTARASCA